jgi:hypothetical protein
MRQKLTRLFVLVLLSVGLTVGVSATAQAQTPGSPVGHLDGVEIQLGQLRATGWAADPDTESHNVAVAIFVDGQLAAYTAEATDARPDVGDAFPAFGPNHGFALTFASTPGAHQVCAAGLNAPGTEGADEALNCIDVFVGQPIGSVDIIEPADSGYHIAGWAIDTDTANPIAVGVFIDGVLVAYTPAASDARPDVEAVYPTFGAAHGFDLAFIAPAGPHQVCAGAINSAGTAGTDQVLGCGGINVPSLVGNFEQLSITPGGLAASGWALDPDVTGQPIAVAVFDNGQLAAYTAAAADERPDVGAVPGYGSNHGFDLGWAATPGNHDVCVVAYNISDTNGSDSILGCTSFVLNATIGNLDLITRTADGVTVAGWAIDTSTTGPASIAVFVDGQLAAFGVAALPRSDVEAAYPAFGPDHGFQADVSTTAGEHEVCVAAGNAAFDPARVIVLSCTTI